MCNLFKDIHFFLSKKLKFQEVTIFRLNYRYIIICVLLFYIKHCTRNEVFH